jgi:hypothetical protein
VRGHKIRHHAHNREEHPRHQRYLGGELNVVKPTSVRTPARTVAPTLRDVFDQGRAGSPDEGVRDPDQGHSYRDNDALSQVDRALA